MNRTPRLIPVKEPQDADGIVIVLHGGASRKDSPMVSPTQLSVVRMIPIAKRVARAGRGRLAVYRLLNSTRGWDSSHTPVDDAVWALDELAQKWGHSTPTALIGHSLGGRAALLASGHPLVSSVVALNPWVYSHDGFGDFAGREFLFVHGDADRIASIQRASTVAHAIERSAPVGFVAVAGGKHAMLRRHGVFSRLAAGFTTATLLAEEPSDEISRVRGEQSWLSL